MARYFSVQRDLVSKGACFAIGDSLGINIYLGGIMGPLD